MKNLSADRYEHIINLPHHQSEKHKRMSMHERAAQFGAFRALSGYEEEITETGRITNEKIEIDEYKKEEINLKLTDILKRIEQNPEISIIYFVPDFKKQGGEYVSRKVRIKNILENEKQIVFEDGEVISVENIFAVHECL